MSSCHKFFNLLILLLKLTCRIILLLILILVSIRLPYLYAQDTSKQQSPQIDQNKPKESTPAATPSLSEALNQSIIFIYEDKTPPNTIPDKVLVGEVLGTAFIIGIPVEGNPNLSFPVVVTAKHVITGQTKVLGRYNSKSGNETIYAPYNLEDLRKSNDLWEHPKDKDLDIVAFRTVVYDNTILAPIPIDLLATEETFLNEYIDVADRVVIPCLMADFPGAKQNYPIYRDGSIALVNKEPISYPMKMGDQIVIVKDQRVIFVNSILNEGFSGAPVFLWPSFRPTPKGPQLGGKLWLIGIVQGFFPIRREILYEDGIPVILNKPIDENITTSTQMKVYSQENSATGIVFPSWRIFEILKSDPVNKRIKQLSDQVSKSPNK